jgi:EAL domain-containing protein (putative c-di-GMP-specific phosphodiesterase class I)
MEIYYQPILALPENAILGFEALLRWNHPEHGLMLPGEFLPEADEPELLLPIGYWGIKQACRDLSDLSTRYPFEPPFSLSINLFRRQLIDPKLPDVLQSIFSETEFPPQSLTLEIKENIIVDDDPLILEAIKNLKSLGVQLTIDDFGSGYSSLRVLPNYPIDTIKIAPIYIRNICRSSEDYEVVRFIVELGQRIGINVIAQGIESPHELIEVQSIKCLQAQGSYFSQPLDKEAVEQLLQQLFQKKANNQRIDPKKLI